VPSGENAAAVASLPLSLLPLPSDDVRWLTKIGVRTIQELRDLPREGVGLRLGARARDVLALAFGEDRAPLTPYVPPEVPEEEAELEYGIEGNEALTFVVKTLTDRIATRLLGRGVSSSRIVLELSLDAVMLADKRDSVVLVELDLPAPLRAAGDLLAALRPKIERLALAAPVLAVKLRAPVLVHQRAVGLSLFEPTPRAERALPRLVAELVSDLGADAVSSLVLGDSWVPVERSRLARFSCTGPDTGAATVKKARTLRSSVPEPTRLLEEPIRIGKDDVKITRHLSRVEGIEWWRSPPTGEGKQRRPVDYVQGWTEDGAALVEIDRKAGTLSIRGWFD
jgi:protein ImuB